ncbi:MAG: ABC transporter ATP-binding protein [Thermoproteota archaeon]|nr:ABC transporter ATP-binding protein [Candidatus Brockarchaeota archaeon]
MISSDVVLEAKDLTVMFKSSSAGLLGKSTLFNAVENCDLSLKTGEVVSLVGESGCGKTTLGKTLIGLIKPTSGEVLYYGKDIWKLNGKDYAEFRRNAQIIHQDPYASLHPVKKVYDIISAGMRYHKLYSSETEIRKKVIELLTIVGLNPPEYFMNKYPHQLSGGQRQRVAIARAISLNPKFIVADEIVTMIDVSLRIGILNLLLELKKKLNSSFLFITHDFGVARYFAAEGRVAIMYLGNIVEIGPTDSIVNEPLHPYTKSLLSAVPVPDPFLAKTRKMIALRSIDPPNPVNPPPGCKFSDRCPYFIEGKCDKKSPELVKVGGNHYVACYLY